MSSSNANVSLAQMSSVDLPYLSAVPIDSDSSGTLDGAALARRHVPARGGVTEVPTARLRDLRRGYGVRMPVVRSARKTRCLRIYDIAITLVEGCEANIDLATVHAFIAGYQSVRPLEPAELLSLSCMLSAALLERAATFPKNSKARETCLASVARIQRIDWRPFASSAMLSNPVEPLLRGESSGIYRTMELMSREPYWRAVERIARFARQSPACVAAAAVSLADAALKDRTDDPRCAHVGYYLVGAGRAELERALHIRLPWFVVVRRVLQPYAAVGFLAMFALVITALVTVALHNPYAPSLSLAQLWIAAPLLALVVSQPVLHLIETVLFKATRAQRLPRLDLTSGIPQGARTLVAVPVMLMRPSQIRHLGALLEQRFLGNRDPQLTFCLLTEFCDAPSPCLPGDAELLQVARATITALNQKHAAHPVLGTRQPFVLVHRERQWNPHDNVWMGWERKRGKLHQLHRLLLGQRSEALTCVVGEPEDLSGVRYVLALDDDTELPPGRAKELIGTALHPLNQPRFDAARGIVSEGFTIIQPAIAAAQMDHSDYAAVAYGAGSHLFYPYLLHRSVYQDAFGEASFHGKAVYDLAMFERATAHAFPENRVLSHDVLEGSFARVGFAGDVPLFEEVPQNYYAAAMRTHRWTRGDWQNGSWMMPRIPATAADGRACKRCNPLSTISRWKIFNSLRQTLVPIGQTLLLIAGWTVLAKPGYWTLLVPASVLAIGITGLLVAPLSTANEATLAQRVRLKARKIVNMVMITLSVSVVMPHQAYLAGDAIVRALWRTYVSRRRVLEWTPYSEVRSKNDLATYVRLMLPVPVLVLLLLAAIAITNPDALPIAAPLLMLWFCSPALVWNVSRLQNK